MRVIFLGRRPHAIEALAWLIEAGHEVVRVVAPSGSGKESVYWSPTVREFAIAHGLPLVDIATLYRELREPGQPALGEIDLAVSFLFWKRIRSPLIEVPKFGCVNFHPAPLPAYKGLGGYNFGILDRLEQWGISAHYVDATIDTGPIIRVAPVPFDWRTATAWSLEHDSRPVTVDLFREIVSDIAACGWLPTTPNQGGRYITRADMDDGKRIDLETMSPEEVDLRARAFWYPPFTGGYVEVDGRKFTLVSPEALDQLSVLHRAEHPQVT